jgi:phosphate transport system permease protein
VFVLVSLVAAALSMAWGGRLAFETFGFKFLWTDAWDPVNQQFGALVPIYGTLVTAFIAMLIAVPVSFGIAMFLTEVAPKWMRGPVGAAIELLAGIPSIIYGMWGLFVLVPVLSEHVYPWVDEHMGQWPIVGRFFAGPPLGLGMGTAGLVLSIMVIPFIASVMREVFLTVPGRLKESAYALGSTRWEVVWDVVLPYTRSAVIGGIFLGLGRALGETMAVTFVLGNAHELTASLLMPGNSIAATIANEFAEADSEMYRSSLIALGFVLFLVTFMRAGRRAPDAAPARRSGRAPDGRFDDRAVRHAPLQERRRAGARHARDALRPVLAGVDRVDHAAQGPGLARPHAVHADDPAARRTGRPAQRDLRQRGDEPARRAFGAPIGVLAGTYLAEYGGTRWSRARRDDPLRQRHPVSAPSIVLGLFVYTLVVAPMGHFSALAGAIALAFIVLPVVVRTTDEMLRLVPAQMREAALSLGVPQWKVTVQVLYRASLPGIVTGILLALARISGETAPLLFTALNNQYWTTDLSQPMANVPVVIFQYAMSPYEQWHTLAWAGAFVLTAFVLLVAIIARAVVSRATSAS